MPTADPRIGARTVLLAVIVPLGLAYAVSAWLGTFFSPLAMLVDTLMLGLLLAVVRLSARGPVAVWVTALLFAVVLVVSHAFKIAQLQLPMLAADLTALGALLTILSGWRLWLAGAILAGLVLLATWALWPRRRGWPGLALAAGLVVGLVLGAPFLATLLQRLAPLDSPDSLVERLELYGGPLFLLEDFASFRHDQFSTPSSEDVQAAVAALVPPRLVPGPGFTPRNVHVVLIETAWDPLALGHYTFSRDPFDPRFRRALELSGGSAALVPGFGGATANAEFEVLCGLPANRDEVTFEHVVRNPMPCLPRLLREAGYLTQANHPYHAEFWNRDNAYPRLGFERYYPLNAFELDNMDGMFLADRSMYRQLLKRLAARQDRRPLFNYVVSLSSHFPYERDAVRRPDLVEVTPKARLLQGYANAIAYSTSAFMDYVDAVHLDDPDALIIGFGDHAPALGHAPDPYALSGIGMSTLRGQGPTEGLADSPVLSMVPLLVFDGRHGVSPVGQVPLFMLPELVLSHLGAQAPQSFLYPFRATATDPSQIRQFLGHMMVRQDGRWRLCRGDVRACRDARALRDRLVTLRQDLAQGDQFALDWAQARNMGHATHMVVQKPFADCGVDVLDWGPRHIAPGEGFNVQPDGKSTFWFRIESGRGKPELRIADLGGIPMTVAGNTATAGVGPMQLASLQDGDPLHWQCADGSEGDIGRLSVGYVLPPPADAGDAGSARGTGSGPPTCRVGLADFGPRQVTIGEGFNVQPDGQSAFWMTLQAGSQGFELWVAGERVQTTRVGDTLSFGARGALLRALSRPGQVSLQLRCGTRVEAHAVVDVVGNA